jgi:hypothetical protein
MSTYRDIISEFKGLNLVQIYNYIKDYNPEYSDCFDDWQHNGTTRGYLIEFFVYYIQNNIIGFNPFKKGADFIEDSGLKFDMKCISLDKNNRLNGDIAISEFDNLDYEESNVINKLKNLILILIDKDFNIVDIYFFNSKKIDEDLREDWDKIMQGVEDERVRNIQGLKYLRCKIRSKYQVFFNYKNGTSIIEVSDKIGIDNNIISQYKYIDELIEKYSFEKSISYEMFVNKITNGENLYKLYKDYVK